MVCGFLSLEFSCGGLRLRSTKGESLQGLKGLGFGGLGLKGFRV